MDYSPEELYDAEKYTDEDNFDSQIDPNYFQSKRDLNPRMRSMLLDWIIEVCHACGFKRKTYHAAAVILDTFLTKVENLERNSLQLAGVTCLAIAAKIEVIYIKKINFLNNRK